MKLISVIALGSVAIMFSCGREKPLAETYDTEVEVTEGPTDVMVEVSMEPPADQPPADPLPDGGTLFSPDAGRWSSCLRHRKAQGHGIGLERSCY